MEIKKEEIDITKLTDEELEKITAGSAYICPGGTFLYNNQCVKLVRGPDGQPMILVMIADPFKKSKKTRSSDQDVT